jgi:hypothetical protein
VVNRNWRTKWVALVVCAAVPGCSAGFANTARCEQIWTVNAVEVRPGMWDLAHRYYEAGWLPARREALRRGLIADYRLLITRDQPDDSPQVQLITVYRNRAQFAAREANFEAIFRTMPVERPISIDGRGRDEIFASTVGLDDYGESFNSDDCVADLLQGRER